MKRVLVLGGGFAGLWSALGAARKRHELGISPTGLEITLVNRFDYHSIRVRNYETDLGETLVPFEKVLTPADVRLVVGDVLDIVLAEKEAVVSTQQGEQRLSYDRLIFALGSELVHPNIPGLHEHAFDVDTFESAQRLNTHIDQLHQQPATDFRYTALVVGSGLTGIEVATELPKKLSAAVKHSGNGAKPRVILIDRHPIIGGAMGGAVPVIHQALSSLGIETIPDVSLAEVRPTGAQLSNGDFIPAATVIWCGGMRAHPLTRRLSAQQDSFGRIPVDCFMKAEGMQDVFAAGDVARAWMDETHTSVMSCQHGRPMGRFAGHNVICDLLGLEMLPLRIDWYTTILDLGAWGAVYTEGWNRQLVSQGEAAKRTKKLINCERIYPPLTGRKEDIFAAAAPVVQTPPKRFSAAGVAEMSGS